MPSSTTSVQRQSISQHVWSDTPTDSAGDDLDDFPRRWAGDYVPLAAGTSRLTHSSVIAYDLMLEDHQHQVRGGALLAVATRSNILLYQSARGERVFRFIKVRVSETYNGLLNRRLLSGHRISILRWHHAV